MSEDDEHKDELAIEPGNGGRYTSRTCKILCMLIFCFLMFIISFEHNELSNKMMHGNHNYHKCLQQGTLQFTTIRGDGLGAQFQAITSSIAYYRKHFRNVNFYYTPINSNRHHHTNGIIIDNFFNFGLNEKKITERNTNIIKWQVTKIVDENPSYYFDNETLNFFHQNYMQDKKNFNISHIQTEYNFNIGIHIRRGDIMRGERQKPRILSNFHYIKIMKHILNQIKLNIIEMNEKQNIVFNIFSEYNFEKNNFSILSEKYLATNDFAIKYFIEYPVTETLHALITSDVLVMSKSGFSYLPALLSRSKYIYYTVFWHHPLNKWNVVVYQNNSDQLKFDEWWSRHNCSQGNITHIDDITILSTIRCKTIWQSIQKTIKFLSKYINTTFCDT
eukprot:389837_1